MSKSVTKHKHTILYLSILSAVLGYSSQGYANLVSENNKIIHIEGDNKDYDGENINIDIDSKNYPDINSAISAETSNSRINLKSFNLSVKNDIFNSKYGIKINSSDKKHTGNELNISTGKININQINGEGAGIYLESNSILDNENEYFNPKNKVNIKNVQLIVESSNSNSENVYGIISNQEGTSINLDAVTVSGNNIVSAFEDHISNQGYYNPKTKDNYSYSNKINQANVNISNSIFSNTTTGNNSRNNVITLVEEIRKNETGSQVDIIDDNGDKTDYHNATISKSSIIGHFHQDKAANRNSKQLLSTNGRWNLILKDTKLSGFSDYDEVTGLSVLNNGRVTADNLSIKIESHKLSDTYTENDLGSAISIDDNSIGDFTNTNIDAKNSVGLYSHNSTTYFKKGNISTSINLLPKDFKPIIAAVTAISGDCANETTNCQKKTNINLDNVNINIKNSSNNAINNKVFGILASAGKERETEITANNIKLTATGRSNGIIANTANSSVKIKDSQISTDEHFFKDTYAAHVLNEGEILIHGESNINGKIKSESNGKIDINVNNGKIKTISEINNNGKIDISLNNKSTLDIVGDSRISNLQTNDSFVNFKKDGDKFTTTRVDNLSGDNGTYTFDVDVVNQKGSKLIIDKSSDGTHIAQGLNDGAQNTTGQEKITLIEDKSGSNAKAVFSPGKDVELGGYAYQVQRDPNNPDNWILAAKTKPGPDPKPTPNDTAKTITGLTSTSYLMNQAEMSTLRQRMGDLTRSAGAAASGDVSGAWGRMYAGNYKTRNNDNLAKADMNYYGFQLGGDVNTVHYSDNTNYLGMFVGHTTGKPDYARGNATATSWYGGFYDTFIADDGFYVDSVVKLGQYRNKYNLKDSQDNGLNGKAQSSVITLSSQAGKRFTLTENDSYNVYAEPQAQLTYSRIGSFNTTASNGLRVKQKAYNSTVARLGVVLGTQINKQSDIYLKTSYLHEFSRDVNYTLNDSRESYSVKGDGLEAGLGMNVKLNDNGYLYAEGDYINSKTHYTGSKFNIGYRYSF